MRKQLPINVRTLERVRIDTEFITMPGMKRNRNSEEKNNNKSGQ